MRIKTKIITYALWAISALTSLLFIASLSLILGS